LDFLQKRKKNEKELKPKTLHTLQASPH